MSEFEYRIRHFAGNLAALKDRKVYLYGTGKNAQAVISRCSDFLKIGAVISADTKSVSGLLSGKRVISLDQALEEKPEVILIAANMYSAEEVYQRIHEKCRKAGVHLTDLYGTDLIALHDEIASHEFMDLGQWRDRCAAYDTVSFELLDTLIERDIFDRNRGRVRPVFMRLIPELRQQGREVLLIGSPEYEREWYRSCLARSGLFTQETFDRAFVMQDWREDFFLDLARDRTV